MADRPNIFLKKTFVAITGASRGLGRSMAIQFGAKFPSGSVMVLMARSKEAMESIRSEILSLAPGINVMVRHYDQENCDNIKYFKDIFHDLLMENSLLQEDFEQYIIVHNCASLGDVSKRSLELSDPTSIRKYLDINLTGMILLNTSFFQTFSDDTKSRLVINMTTGALTYPVGSLHLYCAGKAARDMYFRVLAVEEPSLRILTFVPGISDTVMMEEMESLSVDKSAVDMLKMFRADGKMTHPDTPISKLVQVLEDNSFENAVTVASDTIF